MFTQGLVFYNNDLIESTGVYGQSVMQILRFDEKSKEVYAEGAQKIPDKYFGEGCDVIEDEKGEPLVYQLTWRRRKVLVYKLKNFEKVREFDLPIGISEGWGITHNPLEPSIAYISDSTENLTVVDVSKNFKILKQLKVKNKLGQAVKYLNELEFVDGYIWGNIFLTNFVVKIDPETATIVKKWDLSSVTNKTERYHREKTGRNFGHNDVLNGIAYNHNEKQFYVTGKNWMKVYKIKFN